MNLFLHNDIDVLIVSYGGVGTTFLNKAVGKYKKVNCAGDEDGFKHMPIPPLSFNKKLKVIYVYGDPVMATISLFKRNFQNTQSVKLQKYYFRKKIIPLNMALEDYLDKGFDGLKLEDHFKNWYEKYVFYPVMYVKYEKIFENVSKISNFLELPDSFEKEFPEKKERSSTSNALSPPYLKKLNDRYSPLVCSQNSLEPIVVKASSGPILRNILKNPIYLYAFFVLFVDYMKMGVKKCFPFAVDLKRRIHSGCD